MMSGKLYFQLLFSLCVPICLVGATLTPQEEWGQNAEVLSPQFDIAEYVGIAGASVAYLSFHTVELLSSAYVNAVQNDSVTLSMLQSVDNILELHITQLEKFAEQSQLSNEDQQDAIQLKIVLSGIQQMSRVLQQFILSNGIDEDWKAYVTLRDKTWAELMQLLGSDTSSQKK